MNLLFAYLRPILPHKGGTERVAYTVANALCKAGHSVYFMATHATDDDYGLDSQETHILISKDATQEERKQGIIDTCSNLRIDVLIHVAGETGHQGIFSSSILNGTKVISCLHFDVYGYIKHFLRGNCSSRLKRLLINACYKLGINLTYLKHKASYQKQYREMLQLSDAVVVVTPVIAQQLKDFTGIQSNKIVSILNPVPFSSIRPNYDTQSKEKLIVYAGHISPIKNVDKILNAWASICHRHPDWKLEIAGEGVLKQKLENMVCKRHIPRVSFLGRISDVTDLYNRAEYLVLASDSESFGCVIVESLVYGCHPIVMDFPSASVVIPGKQIGTRIENHSASALAKALDKAISSGVSNKNNMKAVAEHLEAFDISRLVVEWQTLLNSITDTQSHV